MGGGAEKEAIEAIEPFQEITNNFKGPRVCFVCLLFHGIHRSYPSKRRACFNISYTLKWRISFTILLKGEEKDCASKLSAGGKKYKIEQTCLFARLIVAIYLLL